MGVSERLIFRVICLVYLDSKLLLRITANDKLKFVVPFMHGFTSVPFKTESAHGFTQVNGVAKFSSAGVVLEFEAKLFGLIGGGIKEVRIHKDDILDVKFRKGIFKRGAKIEIRTKTFAKLVELPSNEGKLTLKLLRDDFDRGQAAVEQLQKDLAAHAEQQPPPRTPVSQLFEEEFEEETKSLKEEET